MGPKNPLHAWSNDETGTLETLGLVTCKEIDVLDQEIRKLSAITTLEEVLQVHGFAPPKKAESTVCLVHENNKQI